MGALCLCSPAAHASIVNLIAETEMANASFSAVVVDSTGGFSGSAAQISAGGNPGAYRAIVHSSAQGVASGHIVHTHIATWTPSISGEIVSLDMGVDAICFDGGTSNAVGFGLVLVQDAVRYYGPSYTALTASGWRTDLQLTGLVAADFVGMSANPDFSSTGSEIAFGFYTSNGTQSGTPISSSSGADNFAVALTVIPACAGDINGDGLTNASDFTILAGNFGSAVAPNTGGDLSGDGFVNAADFTILAGDFGCIE